MAETNLKPYGKRGVKFMLPITILLLILPLAASKPVVNIHYYEIPHVMKCRVHLPEGYDPAKAYPLLIALHGRGGGAQDFDRLWERQAKAQCLFVTPEGPYVLPFDQRRDIPGYSWYLLVNDRNIWAMADSLGVTAMTNTVAEIKANYKVGPVYILGFSQGASLAYHVAVLHPDIFAGVLAIAGIFPGEFISQENLGKALPTLRIFIAHGRSDPALPMAESEKSRTLLEKAGFAVTFQTFKGGHTLPDDLFQKILAWIGALAA